MSVINQMLRDLDRRQQPHVVSQLPLAPAVLPARHQPRGKLLWLALLLLPIVLALGLYWQQSGSVVVGTASTGGIPAASLPVAAQSLVNNAQEKASNPDSADSTLTSADTAAPDQGRSASGTAKSTQAKPVATMAADNLQATPGGTIAAGNPVTVAVVEAEAAESQLPVPDKPMPAKQEAAKQEPAASSLGLDVGGMSITEVQLTAAELAGRALSQAKAAEAAGRLAEAAREYDKVLSLQPQAHEARRQLAALYYGQQRLDDAVKLLLVGQASFPDEASFPLLLARLWREQGQADKSLASLGRIADGSGLARDKWLLQADIAREQQNHALAEQAYRQLLTNGDGRPQWWLGLAYAQDAQGKFDEAKDNYRHALRGGDLSRDARDYVEQRLMQLGGRQ